jgi:hypothetical protein
MKYGATGNYPWMGNSDVAHIIKEQHPMGRAWIAWCGRTVNDPRDKKPAWAKVCKRCEKASQT